ncbi:MAG: hypothetical protein LUG96_10985 [Tannerellaceae bacterium]|nr:hypothetical protein [Tannerellaceae bacterium]
MKKLVLILLSVLLPMGVFAQQQAEYNIKGDDAMQRQDYTDARLWYGEGVSHCDMYSIDQLTKIWQENESMRLSMRSLMNKCLNCLTVKANERDTVAMAKLVVYYTEWIGTPKNKDLTAYWNRQIRQVQRGVTLRESEKSLLRRNSLPAISIHWKLRWALPWVLCSTGWAFMSVLNPISLPPVIPIPIIIPPARLWSYRLHKPIPMTGRK